MRDNSYHERYRGQFPILREHCQVSAHFHFDRKLHRRAGQKLTCSLRGTGFSWRSGSMPPDSGLKENRSDRCFNFCRSRVPPAAASTSARFDRRLPYITPLISHDGYETNCSSSIFELSQYPPSITALADHRSASAQKRMASIAPPVGHSTDSPLDTHDHPSVDDAARTYNPAKPYLRTQAGYRPIRNFPEHFNAAFMIHMKQQASLCVDKDR